MTPKTFLPLTVLWLTALPVHALEVTSLRCDVTEPRGMDVVQPRLSWLIESDRRGEKQTAYQILVASSPGLLRPGAADLWDSGRVDTGQSVQVLYAGRSLTSRLTCYWKVRAWGTQGKASSWSAPASWTMGLLFTNEWQAKWVGDAESTDVAHAIPPVGPHNGYHSELAHSAEVPKWIAIDLGRTRSLEGFRLFPARPYDWQPDTPGFLFPARFRIEIGERADFSDARTVVDRTAADEPNPGTNALWQQIAPVQARYVRLEATRLRARSGNDFGLALAEIEVLSAGTNVARGAAVTALDSIESGGWAKSNLVDGRTLPQASAPGLAARPAVLFRKEFRLRHPVTRATAYVTGLGLYELHLNGRRVGQDLLAPEWTSYNKRIQCQAYDVTKLLRGGPNAVGAIIAEGWYMGRLMGIPGNAYGSFPRLLLQLEIQTTAGERLTVVTDDSWLSTSHGPIRAAGIYDGESCDARLEQQAWDQPGFVPSQSWKPVRVLEPASGNLVWQRNEPIRITAQLKPVSMSEPKPGVYVFDFGQNIVGWCRLKARGPAGTTVTLRHAEMVNEDGTVYTANLRGAPSSIGSRCADPGKRPSNLGSPTTVSASWN